MNFELTWDLTNMVTGLPSVPEDCPEAVGHLVTSCMRPDPAQRPTAKEVAVQLQAIVSQSQRPAMSGQPVRVPQPAPYRGHLSSSAVPAHTRSGVDQPSSRYQSSHFLFESDASGARHGVREVSGNKAVSKWGVGDTPRERR